MTRQSLPFVLALFSLSACVTRPAAIVQAPPLPPVPVIAASPLPAGASPGMVVPAMAPDGTFATPNRALTPAATLWHLRAGLNVAALACRSDEAAIVGRYNALLAANRQALATAETRYAAEFAEQGGDWRDRYDDAMTRLYNYYSTAPARAGFCAAAAAILTDAAAVPPAQLPTFAADRLPALDRPFTDFFRAYDAWRRGVPAMPRVIIATAAAPVQSAPPAPIKATLPLPRVTIDSAALFDDSIAG